MSGIFISYRRSDSAGHTGRLVDDLTEQLDGQALFRDLEAIEAGVDFVEALEKAVSACSVMLVMIGPSWATVSTADGQRRLQQPGDFVRMEIEAALARNIRVIPILVGDAEMPSAADLPESMHPLLRRNAYSISDRRWQYDIEQLLATLVKLPGIAAMRKQPPPPPVAAVTVQPQLPTGRSTASPAPGGSRNAVPAWVYAAAAAVVVAGIVGVVMTRGARPGDDAAVAATSPAQQPARATDDTPATPPLEQLAAAFLGRWTDENGAHFLIDIGDEGLYVATGTNLAANIGFGDGTPPPHEPGMEVIGNATLDDGTLKGNLEDTFNGAITRIELTQAGDGESLEGTIRVDGSDDSPLVLTRL